MESMTDSFIVVADVGLSNVTVISFVGNFLLAKDLVMCATSILSYDT